jgi:hypothetical protein
VREDSKLGKSLRQDPEVLHVALES